MTKKIKTGTFAFLFSLAAAGTAMALPANIPLAGATNQPIGHYEFCKTHASECRAGARNAPAKVTEFGWDTVRRINASINRAIVPMTDKDLHGTDEYWSYPDGAGDCEDYSIAKYFTLRRLGVPADKLRITYVKALRYNQAHMVLTYYASPGAEPLVLDNLIGEIRPASQRKDLLPVYAFNAEGLYLPGQTGKKSDTKKLSRWQDLLKKMRAEGFDIGEG